MASLAAPALVLPPDAILHDASRRLAYLRELWDADIDPSLFVATARRLGYIVECRWDADADMPTLSPVLIALH